MKSRALTSGEWLVGGLALDWSRYSKGRYSPAQRQAESAGRGIWGGSYVEPWEYRACVPAIAVAQPIAPTTPTRSPLKAQPKTPTS